MLRYGFFIDVGNGWSTLVPSLLFLASMTLHPTQFLLSSSTLEIPAFVLHTWNASNLIHVLTISMFLSLMHSQHWFNLRLCPAPSAGSRYHWNHLVLSGIVRSTFLFVPVSSCKRSPLISQLWHCLVLLVIFLQRETARYSYCRNSWLGRRQQRHLDDLSPDWHVRVISTD